MLSSPDFKQKQIVFAFLSRGDKLSFKNDNVLIKNEDGIKHQSTCYRLFALFLVGHYTITSGLLQRAQRFGFSIYLLNHNLGNYSSFNSKTEGNVLLRKRQYQYYGMEIAKHIVSNKIRNQIVMLKRRRKKSTKLKNIISNMEEYGQRLSEQHGALKNILGIEGIASRVYFSYMFDVVEWKGRKPRVKHDITNLLLDIGYTQLFNLMNSLLNLYGFDLYQGVYHQVFYQRKSLVCDLVEPFRPIVDQCLRNAWMRKQINTADFTLDKQQYRIFGKPAQHYSAILLTELLKYKDAMFSYVQQYYRSFIREKPVNEYPVFYIEVC